jgi:hypothetical protein
MDHSSLPPMLLSLRLISLRRSGNACTVMSAAMIGPRGRERLATAFRATAYAGGFARS